MSPAATSSSTSSSSFTIAVSFPAPLKADVATLDRALDPFHVVAVGDPVTVRVSDRGVDAEPDLLPVGQPIAVGVRREGIGSERQLLPVREAVSVGICLGIEREGMPRGLRIRCHRWP